MLSGILDCTVYSFCWRLLPLGIQRHCPSRGPQDRHRGVLGQLAAKLWEHALGLSLKEVLWSFLLLPHCSNQGSKLSLDLTSHEKDSMVSIIFLLLSRHEARRWISAVHKIFPVSCLPSISTPCSPEVRVTLWLTLVNKIWVRVINKL